MDSVGFKVLTAVVMKSSINWDISPYSPLTMYRRFGRVCRFHLQDQRISQAINQHDADRKQSHGIISQKTQPFI
jgi:hypothetical protein